MSRHVDVIIPVRNGERYLSQAIDSALGQTYEFLSVLVIDDGSVDSTTKIANSYDSRVRCISISPQGLSAARNCGIEASHGEFIAFLDADDAWDRNKVSRQVEYLADDLSCGLVHTRERLIDAQGRSVVSPSTRKSPDKAQGWCFGDLVKSNSIVVSSVLLRREYLGDLRFDCELYGAQDYDLWLQLSRKAPFGFIDEPLMDYRMHEGAMSKATDRMLGDVILIMRRILASNPSPDVAAIARHRLQDWTVERAVRAFEEGRQGEAKLLFQECGDELSWWNRVRYWACYCPTPTVRRLRDLKRGVGRYMGGWRQVS